MGGNVSSPRNRFDILLDAFLLFPIDNRPAVVGGFNTKAAILDILGARLNLLIAEQISDARDTYIGYLLSKLG